MIIKWHIQVAKNTNDKPKTAYACPFANKNLRVINLNRKCVTQRQLAYLLFCLNTKK